MKDLLQLQRLPYQFEDVELGKMEVYEPAQRVFNPARAATLLATLDLTAFGEPVLSYRDERYFVVDGQHRRYALAQFLGAGWETQTVLCKVHCGLTIKQEAALFRKLNTVLSTTAFDKFKVAITEGREEETKIKEIVEANGLHISKNTSSAGAVTSVTALMKAYRMSPKSLMFSLKLTVAAFGDRALESQMIEGFAQLHHRYTAALDDSHTVEALAAMRGGYKGLMTAARKRQLVVGGSLATLIAAESVDVINRHRKGKKLPSWWQVDK